jgi:hypothetical protein
MLHFGLMGAKLLLPENDAFWAVRGLVVSFFDHKVPTLYIPGTPRVTAVHEFSLYRTLYIVSDQV